MIRINLRAAERDKSKKKAVTLGTAGQKLTIGCSLILILAVLFIGSALFVERYPTLTPWATCAHDCPANAFLVLSSEPATAAQSTVRGGALAR